MANDDKPKPDIEAGLEALKTPTTEVDHVTDSSEYGKTPGTCKEHSPQIDEEKLLAFIDKYRDIFKTRFPKLELTVDFTSNGQPPTPEDFRTVPETTAVGGLFVKVGRQYRIGINQNSSPQLKLLTFFHEYGHAVYRREANEAIDNPEALIRTETAALLSSLRLSEEEGLPEIAFLAIDGARLIAPTDIVYQTAMKNVEADPLWQKYSKQTSD